jgi:hypothetical protein
VAEMAVYQIMTNFLHLPADKKCAVMKSDHMAQQLKRLTKQESKNEKPK